MSAWTYQRQTAGKAAQKIVPLPPRTPCWKGPSADSEEKREPVSDINTALVDSLKVLDSKRPIREAVMIGWSDPRSRWRDGGRYTNLALSCMSGDPMRILPATVLIIACVFPAAAQEQPAIPKTAVKPDPTHATFILPKDLKWKRESLGQLQAPLYGDPGKPGPYGILIRWPKGQMSHPHFHTTDRFAYVVSGTWWVSTSDHYDPATTYPLPQGSFATDLANKVHWDGSKNDELILLVTGMGPMKTVTVPDTSAKK